MNQGNDGYRATDSLSYCEYLRSNLSCATTLYYVFVGFDESFALNTSPRPGPRICPLRRQSTDTLSTFGAHVHSAIAALRYDIAVSNLELVSPIAQQIQNEKVARNAVKEWVSSAN